MNGFGKKSAEWESHTSHVRRMAAEEEMEDFFSEIITNQKDVPMEYMDLVDKHFWDLVY